VFSLSFSGATLVGDSSVPQVLTIPALATLPAGCCWFLVQNGSPACPRGGIRRVYREAAADLFPGASDSQRVMEMLELRELCRHLSSCANRGDEATNVIHDIVVKVS